MTTIETAKHRAMLLRAMKPFDQWLQQLDDPALPDDKPLLEVIAENDETHAMTLGHLRMWNKALGR